MGALEYYRCTFSGDLARIQSVSTDQNRISVISLLPSERPSGNLSEVGTAFDKCAHKRLFLFSFFFSALFDQAIHSGLKEEHQYFEPILQYPKFCGILETYHHNIHPALLLLVATLYTTITENDESIEAFREYSDFFINDYCNFLREQYPKLTGRLQTDEEQKAAIRRVLNAMSSSIAILFRPDSLKPYYNQQISNELYEKWLSYFRNLVNNNIDNSDSP
jgi:hypothetical protein